jgi:hypothetical protein
VSRSLVAVLLSSAVGLAVGLACATGNNRKGVKDSCARNLDCAYGLECVDESGAQVAAAGEDAGPPKARTCQWKSFGDCDVTDAPDGGATPASAQGGQQCLAGYRCRDGKCTVVCVGNKDCREGETCKIGICQRQSGGQLAQCFDNRDCPWPETCYYGQCVTRNEGVRCQSDLDCHSGFRCINGICQ